MLDPITPLSVREIGLSEASGKLPLVEVKYPAVTTAPAKVRRPYVYKTTITFGDTDLFRSVYFLNYLKIAGTVRELWVRDCVPNFNQHFDNGLLLITRNVSCDYIKPLFVFDTIRCEMTVERLRITSAELVFSFFKDGTDDLHAIGRHKIVLADRSQKLCPMPKDIFEAAKQILWEAPAPSPRKTLPKSALTS